MKILIAADMEGITGVVNWEHVDPKHPEYARFRRLMTGDVNAAIRGAFEGGAGEVVVSDGHNDGRNILVEELDPRARLNSGSPSPFSMVQGIDAGVDAAMFVGYHARSGSVNANLDHTWSDTRVANLWLNGMLLGETGMNAAVCGHFGAPVIMISGDQTVCGEATELLGALETAVVKQASSRFAAECLPPQVTGQKISEAAARRGAAAAGGKRTGSVPASGTGHRHPGAEPVRHGRPGDDLPRRAPPERQARGSHRRRYAGRLPGIPHPDGPGAELNLLVQA